MTRPTVLIIVALVVLSGLFLTFGFALRGGEVDRRRLEKFALRQRLQITPENGPHVLRALTVIGVWRRFGLVAGLALAMTAAALQGALRVDFIAMFLGWFAGSVVAEWRISGPSAADVPGTASRPRRVALTTRSVSTYLTAFVRVSFWSVTAALTITMAAAGVPAHEHRQFGVWVWWVLVSAAGVIALGLTARRVLHRPQPYVGAAMQDADDALRGHCLTVLAGSAIAAASVPIGQFISLAATATAQPDDAEPFSTVAVVVLMLLGWFVASGTVSIRATRFRRTQQAVREATGQ